jgi:hypothetical protein
MSRPSVLIRLMAGMAWTSMGAALAYALLPAPAGTLATLLIGAVGLVGLRGPARTARSAGVLAAALLACTGVALAITRSDPAAALDGPVAALLSPSFRDPGTWLPVLVSATLVLGTAPLAGWTAAGLEPAAQPVVAEPPPPGPRAPGPRRIELTELAGAGEFGLALLGIDPGGDDGFAMALLDEALAGGLAASDAVCEYGPTERLVVLSGVTASMLRAGGAQLCAAGADLSGRPVRAALATFPAGGSTLREILDRLERDLATCRAHLTILTSD